MDLKETKKPKDSNSKAFHYTIPSDIMDDLLTRFLICVPDSAKQNMVRICFQIEEAHWFYLDFYAANSPTLKPCTMYEFSMHVFHHIPSLKKEVHRMSDILTEWKEYKQSVPTYGAILLSEGLTHVLLVQSYYTKSSWGFPKGKVNEEEDPVHCAIREVLEETGFDITKYISNEEWMEAVVNDQLIRLYIIKNVPMKTQFQPKTRGEIKACEWFPVSDLPNNKKDATPKLKTGVTANAFFMVFPFVRRLKAICCNTTASGSSQKSTNRKKSASISCEEDAWALNDETNTKFNKNKQQPLPPAVAAERRQSTTKRQLVFEAPSDVKFRSNSWDNFKFNRNAILSAL